MVASCHNLPSLIAPYAKPPLQPKVLLRTLARRGLVIEDPAAALHALNRVGYYRLSGYWLPFKQPDDTFEPGLTFATVLGLYELDRQLRMLVLDAIERVEVALRNGKTKIKSVMHGRCLHRRYPHHMETLCQIWTTAGHVSRNPAESARQALMPGQSTYQPPYTITPEILNRVAWVSETIGRLTQLTDPAGALRLRRINRVRTIQGSLAIEGNRLSEAQITAILESQRVLAPPREILEVRNALAAYDRFDTWQPTREADLLEAHRMLMAGLIDGAGAYRSGGVGIMAGDQLIHMAPPADRVPRLMADLFDCAPFIAFMLQITADALAAASPQVAPPVSPQVGELPRALQGEMTRETLQAALGPQDRKSFRTRYLKPALADGLIEMTIPDKPNSRLQHYRLTDKGRQWLERLD